MASQIVSHYRIIRKLGAGGMGEVFLAEDTRLDRKVAIKWLRTKAVASEQARKRLIREAKTAATLDHPNICTIHEIGEDGERAFIVMQYVEGETLADRLDSAPPDLRESVDIAAQVAEALIEAHSHGVVHRDIKPQNVIVTPRGQVKVLDFGLAKLLHLEPVDPENDTQILLTDTGMAIGTVHYMSPEQARGERVDARSDIFALGALLYKCITGRSAFSGNNAIDVCAQVIHVDPSPPSQINPAVPLDLERIVLKALTKNIDARYQSASEMLADLREFQRSFVESSRPSWPSPARDTASLGSSSIARLLDRLGRGSRVRAIVVIALPVALLAAWLALGNRRASPHEPTTAAKGWYEIGTGALRDGAYYQASKALERAVELDSGFTLAHARLAEAYTEIDNIDKAKEELLLAASLVPDRTSLPQADAMYLDAIMGTVRRDFTQAIDQYRKIVEQAADSDKASAQVDLGRAFEKNDNLDKAIESYQQATKLNSQSAAAFLRLAILYGRQQKLKDATEAFDEAEAIYQALSNQEGVTEVFYQRGTLLSRMGKLDEARRKLSEALRMTQNPPTNKYQQIRILLQLSSLSWSEGDTVQAQGHAREAIDLAQAAEMRSLAASGLVDLGTAYFFRGEYDEAEKYFKQALDFAGRSRARRTEARALLSLGSLSVQRGNSDEAIPYIEQARAFYQPGGYGKETSLALNLLGRAYQDKGDYAPALEIFEQQLGLAETIGDALQQALSHASIGLLLGMDQERYTEALNHLTDSYKINSRLGAQLNIGYNLMNSGSLLWRLGRYSEARTALNQALSIAGRPEASYKELLAGVHLSNAQMALSQQRFAQAKEEGQQALDSAGSKYAVIALQAECALGLAKAFSGAPQAGRQLCQQAVTRASETTNPRLLSNALLALAEVMLKTDDAQNALAKALEAQNRFAQSGQQDSEWRAWLIAARASQLSGNESHVKEYISRADNLLLNLQQKWGAREYSSFARRPDVRSYRNQINQLLAINK